MLTAVSHGVNAEEGYDDCAPQSACESEATVTQAAGNLGAKGAALSLAATAAFYSPYKSVDAFAPEAETGESL